VIGYEGATGMPPGATSTSACTAARDGDLRDLPQYIKDYHLPATETARINPLLVLPYRNDVTEMQSLRPADAGRLGLGSPFGKSLSPADDRRRSAVSRRGDSASPPESRRAISRVTG